jgi:hypothetical protein
MHWKESSVIVARRVTERPDSKSQRAAKVATTTIPMARKLNESHEAPLAIASRRAMSVMIVREPM